MLRMKRMRAALAALALGIGLTAAGAATASAGPVYADSSVTLSNGSGGPTDNGPVISADHTNLGTNKDTLPANVQLEANGGFSTHTWAVSPATFDGYTVSITSAGDLVFTAIGGDEQTVTPGTVTVTATDILGAVGVGTVTVTADGNNADLAFTSSNVFCANEDCRAHGFIVGLNNNANGQVDFQAVSPVNPAGLLWSSESLPFVSGQSEGNLPSGLSLTSAGALVASSAIPGTYNEVSVGVQDKTGAVAVQWLDTVVVIGGVVQPNLPVLSHGHWTALSGAHAEVTFVLSGVPACIYFTIVGPGSINGHHGWVSAHLGLNYGWYFGLLPHHGYTVYYVTVGTLGSSSCAGAPTTPIPGTEFAHVFGDTL